MAAPLNLTGNKISLTYDRLVHIPDETDGTLYDGLGVKVSILEVDHAANLGSGGFKISIGTGQDWGIQKWTDGSSNNGLNFWTYNNSNNGILYLNDSGQVTMGYGGSGIVPISGYNLYVRDGVYIGNSGVDGNIKVPSPQTLYLYSDKVRAFKRSIDYPSGQNWDINYALDGHLVALFPVIQDTWSTRYFSTGPSAIPVNIWNGQVLFVNPVTYDRMIRFEGGMYWAGDDGATKVTVTFYSGVSSGDFKIGSIQLRIINDSNNNDVYYHHLDYGWMDTILPAGYSVWVTLEENIYFCNYNYQLNAFEKGKLGL